MIRNIAVLLLAWVVIVVFVLSISRQSNPYDYVCKESKQILVKEGTKVQINDRQVLIVKEAIKPLSHNGGMFLPAGWFISIDGNKYPLMDTYNVYDPVVVSDNIEYVIVYCGHPIIKSGIKLAVLRMDAFRKISASKPDKIIYIDDSGTAKELPQH